MHFSSTYPSACAARHTLNRRLNDYSFSGWAIIANIPLNRGAFDMAIPEVVDLTLSSFDLKKKAILRQIANRHTMHNKELIELLSSATKFVEHYSRILPEKTKKAEEEFSALTNSH